MSEKRTARSLAKHFSYDGFRRFEGDKRLKELVNFAPKSSVPLSFHPAYLFIYKSNMDYPTEQIIDRFVGIKLSNLLTGHYAITYARTMSLIKLSIAQKEANPVWPANYYKEDLSNYEVLLHEAATLAMIERDGNSLYLAPPSFMLLEEALIGIRKYFILDKVIDQVERAFLNPEQIKKVDSFVALKLQKQGLPGNW